MPGHVRPSPAGHPSGLTTNERSPPSFPVIAIYFFPVLFYFFGALGLCCYVWAFSLL